MLIWSHLGLLWALFLLIINKWFDLVSLDYWKHALHRKGYGRTFCVIHLSCLELVQVNIGKNFQRVKFSKGAFDYHLFSRDTPYILFTQRVRHTHRKISQIPNSNFISVGEPHELCMNWHLKKTRLATFQPKQYQISPGVNSVVSSPDCGLSPFFILWI